MAMAHAHSQGLFDYDTAVTVYWPEFVQNGKENVTVRQLLSHQAGLCAIDEPLDLDKLSDPDVVASAIARQKPAWEPGTKHGYHGISLGWYESELLRRVDPQKRTIGCYFRNEIAGPLELNFYIGLPSDVPRSRIATIDGWPPWKLLLNLNKMSWAFVKGFLTPGSITARTFANPKVLGQLNNYNDPRLQAIEIPAANGIGDARSIAKAYSEFAMGGQRLGIKPETMTALKEAAVPPRDGCLDLVLRMNTAFSLGYLKPFPDLPFGSSENAFGTPGAGGSFGFADPDAQVGFAYVMNKSGFYLLNDPREEAVREATYRCLARMT